MRITPLLPNEEKGSFLFPRRNRLMARLLIGTIIVEAGETSGVQYQAAECLRQNKKLLILKSVIDCTSWVEKFINRYSIE